MVLLFSVVSNLFNIFLQAMIGLSRVMKMHLGVLLTMNCMNNLLWAGNGRGDITNTIRLFDSSDILSSLRGFS